MPESQIKVELLNHMGDDLTVVNAARVSFDKNSEPFAWGWAAYEWEGGSWSGEIPILYDKDEKLIAYLAEHGHMSPFGHCFASFRVHAPIFVARQLMKHEYLRVNEVSRRYVDTEPDIYTPDTWRGRSKDKKQGSSGCIEVSHYLQVVTAGLFSRKLAIYNALLDEGVAPEQARIVLPLYTMTTWWWSGSLDAFANMCRLRLAPDTQYESRLVARQVSDHMENLFPVSWRELMKERK